MCTSGSFSARRERVIRFKLENLDSTVGICMLGRRMSLTAVEIDADGLITAQLQSNRKTAR